MADLHVLTPAGTRTVPVDGLYEVLEGLREPSGPLVWVHSEADEAVVDSLADFGLHEVALRSLREGGERPRVEEYVDHLYVSLVFEPGTTEAGARSGLREELRIFVGKRWVISLGRVPEDSLHALADIVRKRVIARARGPSFVLYTLAEWAVSSVSPALDDLVDRIDILETRSIEQQGGEFRKQLLRLKRELADLRQGLVPVRDVMQRLSSRDVEFVEPDSAVFFRDVYQDTLAMLEQLALQHEILASALDLHMSLMSNRLSEIMERLTLVATIFLPLSFITGFFGQNFVQLPYRSDLWFAVMLISVLLVVAGMLAVFRRQRWL